MQRLLQFQGNWGAVNLKNYLAQTELAEKEIK